MREDRRAGRGPGHGQQDGRAPRAQGRAIPVARPSAAGSAWPAFRARLAAWRGGVAGAFAEEASHGRLRLFGPVAFGCGIAAYFLAKQEPSLTASAIAALSLAVVLLLVRARPVAFPVVLAVFLVAAGLFAATWRTYRVATPVLARTAGTLDVTGWVESVERRVRGERLIIRVESLSRLAPDDWPRRIRVTTSSHSPVKTGDFLAIKARLSPVPGPAMPGGYDFARDAFFSGIGASGFVVGKVAAATAPGDMPLGTRLRAAVDAMRTAISARMSAHLTGDAGAIAVALVTGERAAISDAANDMLRASGLAHILSISGFHMALVAGLLFVAIRGSLSLMPGIALTHPIKKYAAVGALAGTSFYMVLSGGDVATLRSWIMISVVFLGVLADRPALTMRSLGFAALVLLALMPESLLHPSFQMSFAATMALVALYERGVPWAIKASTRSGLMRRALMSLGAIIAMSFATSFIAGLATTPYAAFHFHRVSVYGAIGNLVGSPIVSLLSMPLAVIALLAMPFGLEGPVLAAMGASLELFLKINKMVADLPGSIRPVPGFGSGALALMSLGMIVLAVLVTRLRLVGAALLAAGLVVAGWDRPRPVAFVTSDGETLALVGPEGAIAVHGRDKFAAQLWKTVQGQIDAPGAVALTAWPQESPGETPTAPRRRPAAKPAPQRPAQPPPRNPARAPPGPPAATAPAFGTPPEAAIPPAAKTAPAIALPPVDHTAPATAISPAADTAPAVSGKPPPDAPAAAPIPAARAKPPPGASTITFAPARAVPPAPVSVVPMRCDASGCVFTLADGRRLAYARHPSSFADDCDSAAIIVTTLFAPRWCKAMVIDGRRLRATGAVMIGRDAKGDFAIAAARPENEARPWYRRLPTRTAPPRPEPAAPPRTIDPTEAPDAPEAPPENPAE